LRGAHFDGLASVLSGFIVAWGFTYRDRPVQFFGAVPMTGSSVAWITIALVFLQMAWSWERGVPDVIALALASAYVFRDRLRPDRGRTSRASPKRPSHVRAVRDDERWN
jgi:hypothetical protein